jgi:hypothetical protein
MIKVIENIFDLETQDFIENLAMTDVPWFYYHDISGANNHFKDINYFPSGGFSHVAFNNGKPNSLLFKELLNLNNLMNLIAEKFEATIEEFYRVKLNLTTPIYGYKENNFCSPHRDLIIPHHVFLYYINDSDGDTIFFENSEIRVKEDLKISHRITPKKGSCVLFDGSIYHTQANPIKSSVRLNINADVRLKFN